MAGVGMICFCLSRLQALFYFPDRFAFGWHCTMLFNQVVSPCSHIVQYSLSLYLSFGPRLLNDKARLMEKKIMKIYSVFPLALLTC